MNNQDMDSPHDSTKTCLCGFAENENCLLWISCQRCGNRFHSACVLLSDSEVQELQNNKEEWFCNLYQCSEVYTNIKSPDVKENLIHCDRCPENEKHKLYRGVRGIKIHCLTAHPFASQITLNVDDDLQLSPVQEVSKTAKCDICDRTFKNHRGMLIHRNYHDKLSTKIKMKTVKRKSKESTNRSVECPHCHGKYINLNGHITRKHQNVARKNIIEKYLVVNDDDEQEERDENCEIKQKLNEKLDKINNELLPMIQEKPTIEAFDVQVNEIIEILKNSIDVLPGPKHPARKYYEIRKRNEFKNKQKTYKESSNPQRSSKRQKERNQANYNYELMQYEYYNSRRKVVHKLLKKISPREQCNIPKDKIYEYFNTRWSSPNIKTLEDYGPEISSENQKTLDEEYLTVISVENVENAVKSMSIDTGQGLDHVSMRSVKKLKSYDSIASIGTIMQKWNLVPTQFRTAHTILVYKQKGDKKDVKNWRPISICSILRRIIERIIDEKLRKYVGINKNQRGFINTPGCHINTSIIAGILNKAKKENSDCCILLFDVDKAFEESSHDHIVNSFMHIEMPSTLRNLTINLLKGNETKILTGEGLTKTIQVKKGVFQGAPCSPIEYNVSINHVHAELSEPEIAAKYGYQIHPEVINFTNAGFADDLAVASENIEGATELGKIALFNLNKVGYQSNPDKCIAIVIKDGKLVDEKIQLNNDFIIPCLGPDETIKYLGVNFNDEIVFDMPGIIKKFGKDLQNLVSTPMLRADQKLQIINQYVWPTIIYPLQCAPLNKIPNSVLKDLNKLLTSAIKEIIGLPNDIPNAMLYTSKNLRGLGMINATWEAFLQNYNVCLTLLNCNDQFIHYVRDLYKEINECISSLALSDEVMTELRTKNPSTKITKLIRNHLKNEQFKEWCSKQHRGAGVELFEDCKYGNKLILNKSGITSSEWLSTIKMSANVYPVRSLPGRSQDGPLCRYNGCLRRETLPHILGFCEKGELLRNKRHNDDRTIIANYLRKIEHFDVTEEIHCIESNGSTRRVDILCIDKRIKCGYIIDPTIRWEINKGQPEEVHQEKCKIYEPCIPYFLEKYDVNKIEVIGLLIGARGTITSFFEHFRTKFKLPKKLIDDIVIATIRGTNQIAHNHLYG